LSRFPPARLLARLAWLALIARFVIRGLSYLADHIFVVSARAIKVINAAGVQKIKRNILSLQQCLRGLSRSQNDVLARSMAYWDMYEAGPKVSAEVGEWP
jgi:exocyst complex component 4